jgi:hypothetical protein
MPSEPGTLTIEPQVVSNTYCNCPQDGGGHFNHEDYCSYSLSYNPNPKPSPRAGQRAWREYNRKGKDSK